MKTKDTMINVEENYASYGFVVKCIVTRQGIPNAPETFNGIIDTGSGGTCVSSKVMNDIKEALKSKNSSPIEPVGFVKMRGVDSEYVICDVYQVPWFTFGVVSLTNVLIIERKSLPCDCLIGRDVLNCCKHSINPVDNEMEVEILHNKSFQVLIYKSEDDININKLTSFSKYDNISIYAHFDNIQKELTPSSTFVKN